MHDTVPQHACLLDADRLIGFRRLQRHATGSSRVRMRAAWRGGDRQPCSACGGAENGHAQGELNYVSGGFTPGRGGMAAQHAAQGLSFCCESEASMEGGRCHPIQAGGRTDA